MEKKKRVFISNKLILALMSLFIASIIFLTVVALAGDKKQGEKPLTGFSPSPTPTKNEINSNEESMLAVIREVDAELFVMNLTNTNTGDTDTYTYTGAVDVRDKYGKVLSAKQLDVGEMADVTYDALSKRIDKIQISSDIWEYNGLTNLLFNSDKKIISFLDGRYYFDDGILIIDNGKEINLDGFVKKDVFTVRGYGHKICSIILTRGHGYLKLTDAEGFTGGNVYVGNRIWEQISDDMVMTVPEGVYDVTIQFGNYEGTETVSIKRHETVVFYAGKYGPAVESMGRASFYISPYGASLYIDGILQDESNPVELTYGLHKVEVSLGGYRTYSSTITIDKTENSYSITLPPVLPGEDGDQTEDNEDNGGETNNEDDDESDGFIPNITQVPDNTSNNGDATEQETSQEQDTSQNDNGISDGNIMTISYINGTEVYIDGTYVGDIVNGKLVIPKYIGSFDIDLYSEERGIVSYNMVIEDDGEDIEINFPQF